MIPHDKNIWKVQESGGRWELFIYRTLISGFSSKEYAERAGVRINKIINARMKYAFDKGVMSAYDY